MFCKSEWARNKGVAWQHNTKNTVFVYNIIKQLYHSLSLYMNSYTTRAHGIFVKYMCVLLYVYAYKNVLVYKNKYNIIIYIILCFF